MHTTTLSTYHQVTVTNQESRSTVTGTMTQDLRQPLFDCRINRDY